MLISPLAKTPSHQFSRSVLLKFGGYSSRMTKERNNPILIHSSIALLQEKFRQLQKLRETRVERDSLNSSSKGQDNVDGHTTLAKEPNTFRNHVVSSSPSPLLSLWPDTVSDKSHCSRSEELTSRKKRRVSSDSSAESCYIDDGVDTSLHL
ncbi:hypothetical protein MLD38_009950 [Melastoma candidum]|uniref:Uncharacterized protein n=1 Tax=Melastoma candidum TaxID=119954 RepID=A0ACB9QXT4_9MYRT|nr:hypothetical protein MLD38_009950 [Melastoma candidum]